MEMLDSLNKAQEEDRRILGPIDELTGVQRIHGAPLWVVYLHTEKMSSFKI